jgi:general stress protein 26
MSKQQTTTENFRHYLDELFSFRNAMLVTRDRHGDGLHARPMAIAGRSGDGSVWFITNVSSVAIEDVTENPQVNLCMQSGQHFVSVSGTARVTRDRDRIREFWSAEQAVWFEDGIEDSEVALMEVVPTYAEYWDRTGVQGVKFALTEVASLASGRTLKEGEGYAKGEIEFAEHNNRQGPG